MFRSMVRLSFVETMSNKANIRFGICDFPNNQGLGKCYQPWPSAGLVTHTSA